jgi:phosphohistidine phosphatase
MTDTAGTERTLVLVRHAQAEPPGDVLDADRALTERGRADAIEAGTWLAQHGFLPEVVLCSTARRTRETWHGLARGMTGAPDEAGPAGSAPVVRFEPVAYEARPDGLLALVRTLPATTVTALLVAHNPGISLLSALLDPVRAERDGLLTAGVVVHRTTQPWADLSQAAITARR